MHVASDRSFPALQIRNKVAGWDANNLPGKLNSSYMSYSSSEEIGISFDSVNIVEGMELNNDNADTFSLISVDTVCGLAKAKCIVSTYTTYDGDAWTNPLLTAWENTYVGKKLVEPVVYTNQETIQKVQTALNEAGYECGTPDGIAGAKTYEALNAYQEANGLPVTNDITDSLLQKMNLQ